MSEGTGTDSFTAFLQERNAALLSLDYRIITSYMRHYGVTVPADMQMFWAGVHKARCMWAGCPKMARAESAAWLIQHGFQVPE